MRHLLIIIISLHLWACNTHDKNTSNKPSQGSGSKEHQFQNGEDSLINLNNEGNVILDTVSSPDEPVKVISVRFIEKRFSNNKDIRVSYKNISGKDISSIRFKWFGTNELGKPADLGTTVAGFGGGYTGKGLKKGRSNSSGWNVSSKDLKKLHKAWVHEVSFKDGTKWIKGNQPR